MISMYTSCPCSLLGVFSLLLVVVVLLLLNEVSFLCKEGIINKCLLGCLLASVGLQLRMRK